MRKLVVIVCLITLMASGCATRSVGFLPPGMDHEELAAAIACRGQNTAPDAGTREDNPPPLTSLDKSAQFVVTAVPVVGACIVLLPVYVMYILAKAHYSG